jgi:hypothetical protein
MNEYAAQRYTDTECEAVFADLFPQGFAGQDVLEDIAPEGWEQSPLVATFHPSLEQVYEERLQFHRNIQSWPGRHQDRPSDPEPTREEVVREYQTTPIETEREVQELVGECLWDIFSDNHDVLGPDGRMVDIGSFRGAGGFLADYLNGQSGRQEYDYMDFYVGTIWLSRRADLTPVYRMIFRRLKARGYDLAYHFPRLALIDMRPLRDALQPPEEPAWDQGGYAQEEDEEEHERALGEMRESLETAHIEAVAAARAQPPPPTVQAYQSVYGRFPAGWPPTIGSA